MYNVLFSHPVNDQTLMGELHIWQIYYTPLEVTQSYHFQKQKTKLPLCFTFNSSNESFVAASERAIFTHEEEDCLAILKITYTLWKAIYTNEV